MNIILKICLCKLLREKQTIRTCTHTLAADLNWVKQDPGGKTKQDTKYSSQMVRWSGQRAGVTGEKGRNCNERSDRGHRYKREEK